MSNLRINTGQELKDAFKGWFNLADARIKGAARHGVAQGTNVIRDTVKANINSAPFNSSTSTHFGVPLIEGVKTFMYKGIPTGWVHVLGNTRTNDGTWRLRFYEAETTRTNRGTIGGYYFLQNAMSASSQAEEMIMNSIKQTIDDINNQ